MQILENQSLYLNNLISYKSHLEKENIFSFVKHISENINKLGLFLDNKLIFTENNRNYKNIEILIPVNSKIQSCDEYDYKPVFKLINAISIRHEGNFSDIDRTQNKLMEVIREKNYQPITAPYYSIVRFDPDSMNDCIIDIYIGLNYNQL